MPDPTTPSAIPINVKIHFHISYFDTYYMCFIYSCSPTSCSSLPLPPDGVPLHQYMWPRNPCCDVSSITQATSSSDPQNSSSQNYLRLLPKSKENSAGGVNAAAALSHSEWKSPKICNFIWNFFWKSYLKKQCLLVLQGRSTCKNPWKFEEKNFAEY